mgnify:CR=1 FL=1
MRVDTVCIVSIVSGAEADTMYLQCICSLLACTYYLHVGSLAARGRGGAILHVPAPPLVAGGAILLDMTL